MYINTYKVIKATITLIYKIIEWRSWRNRYKIWLSAIKKYLFSLSLLLVIDVITKQVEKSFKIRFSICALAMTIMTLSFGMITQYRWSFSKASIFLHNWKDCSNLIAAKRIMCIKMYSLLWLKLETRTIDHQYDLENQQEEIIHFFNGKKKLFIMGY